MRAPSDLTVFLAHVAAAYPLLGSHARSRPRGATKRSSDAAADGCRFFELRFGPLTHARPGFDVDAVIAAVCEGVAERDRRHRASPPASSSARCATTTRRRTSSWRDAARPPRRCRRRRLRRGRRRAPLSRTSAPYVRPFECAAAAGLGLTAHVAEAGPASNVRDAYETLGVRRIGHGTRLGGDAEVLAWSVDHGMCLEVCATSNVLTGAASSVADAPDSRVPRGRVQRRARGRQPDHDRHDPQPRGRAAAGAAASRPPISVGSRRRRSSSRSASRASGPRSGRGAAVVVARSALGAPRRAETRARRSGRRSLLLHGRRVRHRLKPA